MSKHVLVYYLFQTKAHGVPNHCISKEGSAMIQSSCRILKLVARKGHIRSYHKSTHFSTENVNIAHLIKYI